MGKKKGERNLRVHCTQHRILFEVLEARTLVCPSDGHALAHNFPSGEWWEFCCNCQTFWPSDVGHCGKGREHCPACEQPIGARYLCHRCMVLSNAPKTAPKGRGFRVSALGRVEPCCPGCYSVAPPIIDHQCEGARTPLTTARPFCPFCDEIIWESDALGEGQVEWGHDEVPAPPAAEPDALDSHGAEPEVGADALTPSAANDVLELWPQSEGAGVAVETGGTLRDVLYEFGPSGNGDSEGGLPEEVTSEIEVGEAAVGVQPAPRPAGADTHASVREGPPVIPDAEEVTADAPVSTVTPHDIARGGESPKSDLFLHGYTEPRRAGRGGQRGALLLAGAAVLALIIVAVLWLRPSADADARGGAVETPAGGRAGAAGKGAPPPPPPPEGMVYVPGGAFKMGRDDGDSYERPAHDVTVEPFYIDRFEVTCEEYQRFIDEKKHRAPPGWRNGKYPAGSARLPVTGVSWADADAYARWAGKRLPTEKEWEFAARGPEGRLYPWGSVWKPEGANAKGSGPGRPTEVGRYPEGASPFGAHDIVGNVWEWTADSIRSYEGSSIPEDGLAAAERESRKVIRGGCYLSDARSANATYRRGWPAKGADYTQTGFRCAKDATPLSARN